MYFQSGNRGGIAQPWLRHCKQTSSLQVLLRAETTLILPKLADGG
jgi:hypothetical protein